MSAQSRKGITRRQFIALSSGTIVGLLASCMNTPEPTKAPAPTAVPPTAVPAAEPTAVPPTAAPAAAQPTAAPAAPAAAASKYQEPPVLAELVKAGTLPPVDQRLPAEPLVIPRKAGKYGGTFRVATTDKDPFTWTTRNNGAMQGIPMRLSEDLKTVIPNWYEDCVYSEDKKTIRCSIRPGTKYSNGMEHTADDWVFWHDHIQGEPQVTPEPFSYYTAGGEFMQINKIDKYTFDIVFKEPKPFFVKQCFAHCLGFWGSHVLPVGWMEQFLPDTNPNADADAKAAGFDDWGKRMFFENKQEDSGRPGAPFSGAYMVTKIQPDAVTLERNPYFYAVDEDGKQLPYIDMMVEEKVENDQVIQAKALAGEIDHQSFAFKDYETFAGNADKAGYQIYDWTQLQNYWVYNWNLTCKDPVLREVFQDVRFRRAMSVALNREEMNMIAFAGAAKPSQFTADESTPYWKQEYAEAYAQYDVDLANQLLDEMGLAWDDDEELRVLPDGRPAQISTQVWTTQVHQVMQLAVESWLKVGIKLDYKSVERNLTHDATLSNELPFSCWGGDEIGTVLIGSRPKFFVPAYTDETTMGPLWGQWYESKGKEGEEPPAEIKQLYDWHDMWSATGDAEYMDNMLKYNAENLLTVGTLVGPPNPQLFNKKLQNVPLVKADGWDTLSAIHVYPEAWWFEV